MAADDDPCRKAMRDILQNSALHQISEDAATEYYQLIDEDQHGVMGDWNVVRQFELLQLEHPQYSNRLALTHAFSNEKFDFIKALLEMLLALDPAEICERNFIHTIEENLSKLLTSSANADRPELTNLVVDIWRKHSSVLNRLFTCRNDNNVLTLNLIQTLLFELAAEKTMELLKPMVCCCEKEKHEGPNPECKHRYNLLMYTLTQQNKDVTEKVYTILKHTSCEDDVTEIVLGRRSAVVEESTSSNSLLIAAEREMWPEFNKLFTVLPNQQKARALLETDHDGKSALQELVRSPDQLENTAKYTNIIKELKDAFDKSTLWRYRFSELQMPQDSIGVFEYYQLDEERYVIPKRGEKEMSEPAAIILYNAKELYEVENETKALEEAICQFTLRKRVTRQTLKTSGNKPTGLRKRIKKIKDSCSLFILCVSSHGDVRGVESVNGGIVSISELLKEMGQLPDFIPKVLILDRCRTPVEELADEKDKLKKSNIFKIEATLPGEPAVDGFYLKHFATVMKCGNKTVQKMHTLATSAAKKKDAGCHELPEGTSWEDVTSSTTGVESAGGRQPSARTRKKKKNCKNDENKQTPQEESTAREIFLRKCQSKCQDCSRSQTSYDQQRHVLCCNCLTPNCIECIPMTVEQAKQCSQTTEFKWICRGCK